MKKILKKIILVIVILLSQINRIEASSGKIAVYYSNSKPTIGTTITIRITATCANGIGGGKIIIDYDSSYFKLSKNNAEENYNSTNHMLMLEPTSNQSESYTFIFTAVKVGKTKITVNTIQYIDYDIDDITGYSEEIEIDFNIQTKTNNNPGTTPLSGDNSLSSLSVENFKFEENFSPDKDEYTLFVPNDTDSLNILAKPSSGKAKIKDYNYNLVEGWNKIEIVCVAENKDERKYTINVYVEESPKTFFDYEGKKLGAVVFLDKTDKPGFEKTEFNDLTLFKNSGYELLYLIDEEGNREFYQYDSVNNKIIDVYKTFNINNREFVLTKVDYDKFAEFSHGNFVQSRIIIDDIELDGWKYIEDYKNEMVIIFLKNEEGKEGLYQYDTKEKTIQRFLYEYVEPEIIVEKNPIYPIVLAISAGLFVLSLLYVIRSNIKIKKMRIISK